MRHDRRSFLLLLLAACSATPSGARIDHIDERIVSLQAAADGDTWVGFEYSARAFLILREDPELLAFARQALASGRPVHATVRSAHGPKTVLMGEGGTAAAAASRTDVAVVALAWLR